MSKKKETQLTMDTLLKLTPEVFRDTVKAQPLGFNKSLLNLLKAQFEQLSLAKESLLVVLEKGNVPEEDKESFNNTLRDIYISMQLIEDRHTILSLVIEDNEGLMRP